MIRVTDRDRVPGSGLLGASILWAIAAIQPDSLRITDATFDERFGVEAAREALLRGEDPNAVIARYQPAVDAFIRATTPFRIYPP